MVTGLCVCRCGVVKKITVRDAKEAIGIFQTCELHSVVFVINKWFYALLLGFKMLTIGWDN